MVLFHYHYFSQTSVKLNPVSKGQISYPKQAFYIECKLTCNKEFWPFPWLLPLDKFDCIVIIIIIVFIYLFFLGGGWGGGGEPRNLTL